MAVESGNRRFRGSRAFWVLATLLSGPAAAGLSWLSGLAPWMVERWYAESFYPAWCRVPDWLLGRLPFAFGELLLLLLLAALFVFAVRFLAQLARSPREAGRTLLRGLIVAAAGASLLYAGFVVAWGFNYRRPPLPALLGWPVESPRAEELQALGARLVPEVNRLRASLRAWAAFGDVASRADEGYRRLGSALAPAVRPVRTPGVKPAIFSALMSRSLTYGMAVPWTHEALINRTTPAAALPFTVCHEMAHLRGIAREDEANFVGYLAARRHPDLDYQYSAQRFALHEVLAQLARVDLESARNLLRGLDPAVREDDRLEAEWAREHRSAFSRVQGRVYEGYLKAQGQREGLRSYGRVVDLLIAEERLRKAGRLPLELAN